MMLILLFLILPTLFSVISAGPNCGLDDPDFTLKLPNDTGSPIVCRPPQDVHRLIKSLSDSKNKTFRSTTIREYVHACHRCNKSLDLDDCMLPFIEGCLNTSALHKEPPAPCLNLLYSYCGSSPSAKCKEAVENVVEKALEERCSNKADECDKLIDDIFSSPYQFNSIKRIGSALRGGLRGRNPSYTYDKTKRVIEELSMNINNASNIIDADDVTTFLGVMDTSFESSQDEVGPMLLMNLKQLNYLFGRSILSGGGRIKSNYTFNGNNLDVAFGITDRDENIFEHASDKGFSVEVVVPHRALCHNATQFISSNETGDYDDDDDNDGYETPDKYARCYPPSFLPGCRYVVTSSFAHNISTSFGKLSNRTLVSIVSSLQVVSDNSTGSSDRFELLQRISMTFNVIKFNKSGPFPVCNYWNSSLQNWSTDGMRTRFLSSSQVLCTSNHLASFAVLIDYTGTTITYNPEVNIESFALKVTSYIGLTISIVCLIITIVLLIALRKQFQKGPLLYVHINLSLALLLGWLTYMFGIELPKSITWLCSVVAGLLHYLFLCVFCWSLAEGIMLYILIVKVYGSLADKWYLLLPLGWGLPVIIVVISAAINHDLYGTENYCWLSTDKEMVWSFIGPMILIIIINAAFLISTIYHILRSKATGGAEFDVKKINIVKSGIKGVIVLLPLLGITWIIGIFTVNTQSTVFFWLFTFFTTLQGLAILYLHVLRNKFITDWTKKKISGLRASISSMTTNQSNVKSSSNESRASV